MRGSVPGVSPWHLGPCSHRLLLTTSEAKQGSGVLSDLWRVLALGRAEFKPGLPPAPQYHTQEQVPLSQQPLLFSVPKEQVDWSPRGWALE